MVDFKLFGVKFSVSIGFLCVITIMLYLDKTGYMMPTLEAVLLHETGHILALKILKQPPDRVELKIGSIALNGRYNLNNMGTAIMLFSGPMANFTASLLLFSGYKYCGKEVLLVNCIIMLIVGIYNLLPITGLDGGELTALFLIRIFGENVGRKTQKTIGIIFSCLLLLFGAFVCLDSKKNPSLLLFAIYLLVCSLKSKD